MDILDGDVDFLCKFVVFHDFGTGAEGDLGGCVDEGTGVDDEVAWGGGDDAFGVGCGEDCGEEFFVLDGAGLFDSYHGLRTSSNGALWLEVIVGMVYLV